MFTCLTEKLEFVTKSIDSFNIGVVLEGGAKLTLLACNVLLVEAKQLYIVSFCYKFVNGAAILAYPRLFV